MTVAMTHANHFSYALGDIAINILKFKSIMNIFASLKQYAGKWSVKASRDFTDEEKAAVKSAEVIASKEGYGNSVCFFMHSGVQQFIPLSNTSSLSVGDTVDLSKAKLLTLERAGEADIYRVEA